MSIEQFTIVCCFNKTCEQCQSDTEKCRTVVIPSSQQTKEWRSSQDWYQNGKHNECEIYQRNLIEKITLMKCRKTHVRLNLCDYQMKTVVSPNKQPDGFEWTEDFDGLIEIESKQLYFNLKMVCSAGGAQNRTLREVYHFIRSQLEHLLLFPESSINVYFINILDGDESAHYINKFHHLLSKEKYSIIKDKVYVGDLYQFQSNRWPTI